MIDFLLARVNVDASVARAAQAAAHFLEARDLRAARNRVRVIDAFLAEGIAESDLGPSFGYGYDDPARARYEALLARLFGAERALARLSLVSGTHAIVTALAACVPPGARLISATGRPYDTLYNAIVEAPHSLVANGMRYDEIALNARGRVDHAALATACEGDAAAVFVQRSRGYAARESLSAEACGEVVRCVKRVAPNALVLVDNCYGELVDETEPTQHGADAVMGSLIKNLGGGLAPAGGYIAGRASVLERIEARHYAPGLGGALGPSLGFGRTLVQGLWYAPLTVGETLAGLDFAAALFAELGYAVDPLPGAQRHDIVQAIRLGSAQRLVQFARGLQRAMPLNARFSPQSGSVPGYRVPVVMSSGAFISGATSELSCDAPLREPFEAYLQGGTMREHVAIGAILAADALVPRKRVAVDVRSKRPKGEEDGLVMENGSRSTGTERPYVRRYLRTTVDIPVLYEREGQTEHPAQITDLGGGGLRLATDEDLPLGTVLIVRFRLAEAQRDVVARGRIVLSFFNAEHKRFFHGIAFTHIDPADQEELIRFVAAEVERTQAKS